MFLDYMVIRQESKKSHKKVFLSGPALTAYISMKSAILLGMFLISNLEYQFLNLLHPEILDDRLLQLGDAGHGLIVFFFQIHQFFSASGFFFRPVVLACICSKEKTAFFSWLPNLKKKINKCPLRRTMVHFQEKWSSSIKYHKKLHQELS